MVRQATVNVQLVEAALRRDPSSVGDLLTGLAASPEAAIFVRQPDGWISGGTAADGLGPDDVAADLLAAAERGDIARQRLRGRGIPVVAVAMPLPGTGEEYVEVFPLRDLDRTFRFVSLLLGGGVLAGALLGATVGLWASRRALRPLTELTEAAGRVAYGDRPPGSRCALTPTSGRSPRRSTRTPPICRPGWSATPGSPPTSATSCAPPSPPWPRRWRSWSAAGTTPHTRGPARDRPAGRRPAPVPPAGGGPA